jgi:phage gp36-like protein
MAYATISDVFARYPAINTMVGTLANEVSSVNVSSIFIADAESLINAYLGARYNLPLTPEPLITQLTSDLAIFAMCAERLPRVPEWMQHRYDRSISYLEKLRDGTMILNPASNTFVSTGDNFAFSTTQSYHPVFSPVLHELDQQEDYDFVRGEINTRSADVG